MISPEHPKSSGPHGDDGRGEGGVDGDEGAQLRARREHHVDDPTGVHALLSSLPEPGPMPADLVERINASLREEADRTGASDDRVSYALFAGRHPRSGQSPWLRVAAVAALALLVGGGLLAGTGGLTPAFLGLAGGSAGAVSASPSNPTTAPAAASPGATEPSPGPSSRAGGSAQNGLSGAQRFVQTRTNYQSATLRDQAAALVAAPPLAIPDLAAEAPHLGPIATPTGLASCLAALDLRGDAQAVVDLATYDGRPVAVIVTRHGDHDEVRVVKRECTTGSPDLVTGPYAL